jgi:hypothetical protein
MYNTFKEAKDANDISENIMCINVIEHKNSLERFEQGGRVLRKLGPGSLLSPGHPRGNHMYYNLYPFFGKVVSQTRFPVFVKRKNRVYYEGLYMFQSVDKKTSHEGFTYFEIKLYRASSYVTPDKVLPPLE